MRLSIFSLVPCPWPLVGSDYVWTLKPVSCWVLNFCDYIKTFLKLFLLMGSGWGLAMLGPRLFIFFQGRTAWFCVKGSFPVNFYFSFHITVMTSSLFPCWVFEFWFWFPAKHISIAQFLSPWHILNVRWLVQFLFISRLFKVLLGCLFLGCHPCFWDLWLSFLFS